MKNKNHKKIVSFFFVLDNMSNKNDCYTCSQSRKKQKGSVMCMGCLKPFCKDHHLEHRKLLDKDFEDLIQQHNIVRQTLFNENNQQNLKLSQLIKVIDDWENDMIANIKEIVAQNKARLHSIINEEKDILKDKFESMAQELRANQSNNDYVESDIQQWQSQINECKQKLEQLQKSNNDFIDVETKSIDCNKGISIRQRKDVVIKRTNTDVRLECRECERFYYETSGYNDTFCSEDCERIYDQRNPDESSSNNEDDNNEEEYDGCFAGDCLVQLANGSTKQVKHIRKGDLVRTSNEQIATVNYTIQIKRKTKRAPMVVFDNGLVITPWHPIRINDKWIFPHDIRQQTFIECDEVYNFALDIGHIMIINGVECATLGHNFKGEVIEHPYFGSNQVLDDLHRMDICNDGFIQVSSDSIVRNHETGLISSICRQNARVDLTTILSEQYI